MSERNISHVSSPLSFQEITNEFTTYFNCSGGELCNYQDFHIQSKGNTHATNNYRDAREKPNDYHSPREKLIDYIQVKPNKNTIQFGSIPEFLGSGRKSQTLDSGRWTLDSGRQTLEAGLWMLDSEAWMLNSRRWTPDIECQTMDVKTLKFKTVQSF